MKTIALSARPGNLKNCRFNPLTHTTVIVELTVAGYTLQ